LKGFGGAPDPLTFNITKTMRNMKGQSKLNGVFGEKIGQEKGRGVYPSPYLDVIFGEKRI
jgi:hypothetical protein